MTTRANSLEGRRAKLTTADAMLAHSETIAVILSVKLDNGDFEASVRVPLNDQENFDTYIARWLKLVHTALIHGVEEMQATLTTEKKD